jgi:hypothetical protein
MFIYSSLTRGVVIWLCFYASIACAAELEIIKVSPDQEGFVLAPSGTKFIPWGHNYASVDILARLAKDPARVEREFAEMKAAGTTVARVHPEFLHLMAGPDKTKPEGVQLLLKLLKIAEARGIYLKITGLANYTIKDRAEWYDKLDEAARWKAQAFFWEMIANACKDSPAVFAYDLVNEPVPTGKPDEGWYMGRMGDVEFCQRFTLTPGKRSGEDVMRDWTRMMIAAIRKHDGRHLITMGMFPFPGVYKPIAEQLDFVSPHLYPKTGKVDEELKLLQQFDWGKPIVIGETFPLSKAAAPPTAGSATGRTNRPWNWRSSRKVARQRSRTRFGFPGSSCSRRWGRRC